MDFYKILNKDEKHFELQYQTGLNVDPLPFDPSGSCKPGGIYFSREDILAFISIGPWIRKVILPEDARVYENPGEPKKWKADKVILGEREKLDDVNVIKRLIEEGANPKIRNSYPLQLAAKYGHIEIVKLLLPLSDPTDDDSLALRWAAEYDRTEIVKLLLEAGADPNANDSLALRWAAEFGHIEIVKLLLPVSHITKYCLQYINHYCKNQEILGLIYSNYQNGVS
jgi:hypothetical protein